jgi:hypothetical protein
MGMLQAGQMMLKPMLFTHLPNCLPQRGHVVEVFVAASIFREACTRYLSVE